MLIVRYPRITGATTSPIHMHSKTEETGITPLEGGTHMRSKEETLTPNREVTLMLNKEAQSKDTAGGSSMVEELQMGHTVGYGYIGLNTQADIKQPAAMKWKCQR